MSRRGTSCRSSMGGWVLLIVGWRRVTTGQPYFLTHASFFLLPLQTFTIFILIRLQFLLDHHNSVYESFSIITTASIIHLSCYPLSPLFRPQEFAASDLTTENLLPQTPASRIFIVSFCSRVLTAILTFALLEPSSALLSWTYHYLPRK